MTLSAPTQSGDRPIFFVHTHALPAALDRRSICGAVVVVETDAERLRFYYGWEHGSLPVEGFLKAWPNLRSRLELTPSARCPLALEDIAAAPDLDAHLEDYVRDGLEVIQLFHWDENEFIDAEGLTAHGRSLLSRMSALNLVLDVSHLSGRRLREVAETYQGRLLASHVVARAALSGNGPRANSLTSDELRLLADRRALVGIPFVNDLVAFLGADEVGNYCTSIEDVVRQVFTLAEVMGLSHLSFGPDYFDFANYSRRLGVNLRVVADLDCSGGFQALRSTLIENGLTPVQVDRIFAGNALRFFRHESSLSEVTGEDGSGETPVAIAPDSLTLLRWTFSETASASAKQSAQHGLLEAPWPPSSAWVTLSNYCNLTCRHCRRTYRERTANDLVKTISDHLYDRIVTEVVPGLHSLILGGNNNSEVTRAVRFPRLIEYLARFGKHNLRLSLQTNGSRIPDYLVEQLVSLNTVFNISVEGGSNATTSRIRGIPLDSVGRCIGRINRQRVSSRSDARIVLSFTAMRSNIEELPELVEFAERNGVDEVNVMYLLPATEEWNAESPVYCADTVNRVLERTYQLSRAWHVCLLAPPIQAVVDQPCIKPWYSVSINGNGQVRFCCLENSPVIGSLNEQTLHDIWNGAPARAARTLVNAENPPGECGACVLRNLPYVSVESLRKQLAGR